MGDCRIKYCRNAARRVEYGWAIYRQAIYRLVAALLLVAVPLKVAAAADGERPDRVSLAAAPPAPRPYAAAVSDPDDLLPNFDPDTLVPVLEELDFDVIGAVTPDGSRLLFVRSDDDLRFVIRPMNCDSREKTACKAAALIAMFRARAPQNLLIAFNERYPFAYAGLDPSGVAYLSRYELADYGLVKGNFIASLELFLRRSDQLWDALNALSRSVKGDPSSDHMPSIQESRLAIAENAARINDRNTALEKSDHLLALGSLERFVGALIEADTADPDKIINPALEGRPGSQ